MPGEMISYSYVMLDKKLYKKLFSLSLLKCFQLTEANYSLQEVHEEICGNHL